MNPTTPTPEPTPLTDAKTFDVVVHGDAYTERDYYPDGCGDYVLADDMREVEKQLSDTRRRLAEVEKERDRLRDVKWEGIAAIEKQRDDATAKLTALRNAADGVLSGLREAEHALIDPIYIFNNDSADRIECRACGESAPLDKPAPFGDPIRPIEHHPDCALLAVQKAIEKHSALIAEGVGS